MGHSRTVGLAVNEMGAIRALEQRDALAFWDVLHPRRVPLAAGRSSSTIRKVI